MTIKFTYERDRIPDKVEKEMFAAYLDTMLAGIKELAEHKNHAA